MKINYCLPIIKTEKSEVKSEIGKNINEFEYLEVWLDYVEDIDEKFVIELSESLGGKLILLFRRQNLEKVKMPKDERCSIINLLNEKSVFLDLDIFDQKEELEFIKNNNLEIKKIVSYHSYEKTPVNEQIHEIIDTMNTYNPEIVKIATMCNSEADALGLLQLQLVLKEKKIKHIISGMGDYGKITKIFGTIWGNEMVFCPAKQDEASAPGQLTKRQLENIFKKLGA